MAQPWASVAAAYARSALVGGLVEAAREPVGERLRGCQVALAGGLPAPRDGDGLVAAPADGERLGHGDRGADAGRARARVRRPRPARPAPAPRAGRPARRQSGRAGHAARRVRARPSRVALGGRRVVAARAAARASACAAADRPRGPRRAAELAGARRRRGPSSASAGGRASRRGSKARNERQRRLGALARGGQTGEDALRVLGPAGGHQRACLGRDRRENPHAGLKRGAGEAVFGKVDVREDARPVQVFRCGRRSVATSSASSLRGPGRNPRSRSGSS